MGTKNAASPLRSLTGHWCSYPPYEQASNGDRCWTRLRRLHFADPIGIARPALCKRICIHADAFPYEQEYASGAGVMARDWPHSGIKYSGCSLYRDELLGLQPTGQGGILARTVKSIVEISAHQSQQDADMLSFFKKVCLPGQDGYKKSCARDTINRSGLA